MLEGLCGNKNVQRILLFLFVNGKCYGTQLHRILGAPLTPLQKALNRLEKGQIITSYFEGKTRLYQFNPAYPLLKELEELLKKAYTLLPAQERKNFYAIREDLTTTVDQESKLQSLLLFWDKLKTVTQLSFHAKTKSKEDRGWNGRGKGEVSALQENSNAIIFQEKGTWQGKEGGELVFSNAFRWTLDRNAGVIALEHLRMGIDRPVFLFHLAPTGKYSLSSVHSHLCGGDAYFGQIHFDRLSLRLNWRVIGPRKNEELDYYYS